MRLLQYSEAAFGHAHPSDPDSMGFSGPETPSAEDLEAYGEEEE